ncbi:Ig-like domain-containing protein [Maribacter sp. R77961]|uniref:Ig-like domain-containing protein n=1 Tax=Maribacter sp. R77961 TaxID=3093871 RepID=UPI0037C5E58A
MKANLLLNKSKKIGIVFLTFSMFSAIPYFADSGLDTPEPIDSFLNGAFPDKSNTAEPYVSAFPNLRFDSPLTFTTIPNSNKLVVGQRDGKIFWFENDNDIANKNLLADLSNEVGVVWDGGFLGLSIHPEFGTSGKNYFYLFYTTKDRNGDNYPNGFISGFGCNREDFWGNYLILKRIEVNPNNLDVVPNSGLEMIKMRMFSSTHRGGGMSFGNDGYLYIPTGDQSAYSKSQIIDTNLDGGVLRIDVDQNPTKSHAPIRKMPEGGRFADEISGVGYWIPNDNPFPSPNGNRFEEYYSIGHRNPHRMTKDRLTGTMYIGEIGEGTHEEINVVRPGKNYGWPLWEGNMFTNRNCIEMLDNMPHERPLVSFPRAEANAIIGGYVYRGNAMPDYYGKYFCADYGVGEEIWAVDINTGQYELVTEFSPTNIISFGEDNKGELYLLSQGDNVPLYKLRQSAELEGNVPSLLSETGAFQDLQTLQPSQGVIPYELIEAFWSDGAEKKRWMAIPNNGSHDTASEQISFSENSDWEFPVGSVLIKHFELSIDENNPSLTKRLETRFSIKTTNGSFYYLTYKWNDAQTDALLLESGLNENIQISKADGSTEIQTWTYPSAADCISCHNPATGGTLGTRTRYLNSDYTYEKTGKTGNQLVTLSHLGILNATIDDADTENFQTYKTLADDTATLDEKARSYLDLNCAYCHRPGGTGERAQFDLRLFNSLAQTNLLTVGTNTPIGIDGEKIVVPGDASKSILFHRTNSTDASIAMPPIAKNTVDERAVSLISEWINQLDPNTITPKIKPSTYKITNVGSGKVMDISGQSQENYADVHQWEDLAAENQQFIVQSVNDTDYRIKAVHSNKNIDVEGRGQAPGTNVIQFDENGTIAQDFKFEYIEDNQFVIKSLANGLYLGVENNADTAGASIKTYSYDGSDYFKWIFTDLINTPEPTCDDGLKNGDETGIDCGGSCTNSCPCEGEIVVSIDFENASASDWITSGTASTGTFIVADPTSQVTSGIITQLEDDHSPQGTNAFFTATNTSVGANDVDQGVSIATSPVYRITQDSELSIWYFFGQRDAGDDPDDYFLLEYSLDNGTSYTALASYGDETVNAQWTEAKAEIPQGSDLVLRVSASDGTSNGDIIEAGIDDFVVTSLCREPVLVTGIVLSEENISLEVGENITIDASVQPEDADDTLVNWSSSDENIANVNSDGTITAIAEGIATITATTNDGDFTANVSVTVTSPDIPVTGININPEAANLIIGETINLSANVIPQNATNTQITWSSSDNTIATVDANGVVLAQAPGVATISAITADGAFEDTSNITVEPNSIGVTGVTLNESSATLEIGQSIVLTATINPEDATDQTVQWSSSDETIATVDGNGEVIAVSEGTATITVTTVDGAYTADLTLTVDSTTCASVNLTPEYNINGQEYVAAESNGSITLSEGDWLILSVLPNDGAFSITGPNGNEKPMDINDLTLFNFSQSDTGIYTFTTEDGCTTSLEVLIDSTPVNCASVNLIPEYNINGQEYLAAESNGSITLSEGDWLILSVLPNDGAFSITGPNGNEKPMDINDLTLFNFSQSDTGIYTFTTEDGCTTTLNITIDDAPVNCTSVGLIPEYNINGQEYLAGEDNATLSLNQGDWIILSVLPNDGAFSITGPNNKPMDIQDLTIFDLSESDTGTYTFTTENGCTTTLDLTLENTPLDCTNINLVPEYNINGQDYLQAEDNQVLSLTEGDWIILSILPNEEGAFSVSGANGNDKDMGIEDLVIFNLGPEDAGDYQFTTENGCTTVLTLQVVPSVSALTTITPLLETEGTGELSVFPNPSKGMVTIDLRSLSQKNVNITVYNSSGKIVHETVFAENHGAFEEMNLEQLSDGVYHILFRTVDKIEAKSLIIK